MLIVIIPLIVLIIFILNPRFPVIGGHIQAGFMITGLIALIMGGVYHPADWILAWLDGISRIAWVIGLSVFGSVYAETQVEMGTMDTVIQTLRSIFGYSPKGLIIAVMIALTIAGSLLGDAIATSTVIGVLVIRSLAEMELSGEQISATIVMGACLGSIMPPISHAAALAASLAGASADPVLTITFGTAGICLAVCCVYVSGAFAKIKSLPEDLIPRESVGRILSKNWTNLIPMTILILLVVARIAFKFDPATKSVIGLADLFRVSPIMREEANPIVLNIFIVMIVSFFYPRVRGKLGAVVIRGLRNARTSFSIQVSAGLMLGAFYRAGQIEAVYRIARNLNEALLKLGGSAALCLIGMLTGSQTTAQNSILSFFGPALVELGHDPIHVAVAGAHLAMSGQGLPPADLTTFVVAGLVGGILGVKVSPLKSMLYSSVMCVCFLIVGAVFLNIK